jgi:hypothetical protein
LRWDILSGDLSEKLVSFDWEVTGATQNKIYG